LKLGQWGDSKQASVEGGGQGRVGDMFASTSQSTWCPNPEEYHQYRHHHENLKSHIFYLFIHYVFTYFIYYEHTAYHAFPLSASSWPFELEKKFAMI
jgi:hypothetical protein